MLKLCIPGCDKVEAAGENQYAVGMAVKIGPVAARFNGRITLTEVKPPNSYRISFDGQGGAAGFGKGHALVNLAPPEEGSGCVLRYTASAQVGGKIAQMGQRLIDGVARGMAEDFFKRFDQNAAPLSAAYVAQAAVEARWAAPRLPQARIPPGHGLRGSPLQRWRPGGWSATGPMFSRGMNDRRSRGHVLVDGCGWVARCRHAQSGHRA